MTLLLAKEDLLLKSLASHLTAGLIRINLWETRSLAVDLSSERHRDRPPREALPGCRRPV